MTRPLRLQYPGALYHVAARGNHREAIYRDSGDRLAWMDIMGTVCTRFNFIVHGYCQMTNHYHVLVETPDGNLARGMRHLNGVYSQFVNRKHGTVGHLFQGRYHATLIQKEAHLLELIRYVVLNPIRARIVSDADKWKWSSHRFCLGRARAPDWLETAWVLGQFGTATTAHSAYRQFVADGLGLPSPLEDINYQLVLGDDEILADHRTEHSSQGLDEITRVQRRALAMSLDEYWRKYPDRNEAMTRAYRSTAYTMIQIADYCGLSYKTIGRSIRAFENAEVDFGKD